MINFLPEELQIEVFSFLTTEEKLQISLLSKDFHRKAFHPSIWKKLRINQRNTTKFEPKLYHFLSKFTQTTYLNLHSPKLETYQQLSKLPMTQTIIKLNINVSNIDIHNLFEIFPNLKEIHLPITEVKDAILFLERKIKLYSNWDLYDKLLTIYNQEFLEKYLNVEEDLSKQKQGVILNAAKRGINMNFLDMDNLMLKLLSEGFSFLLQNLVPFGYKFERIVNNLKMKDIILMFLKRGSPYYELFGLQKLGFKFQGSEIFDQCIFELLNNNQEKKIISVLTLEYPFERIFKSEKMDQLVKSFILNQRFDIIQKFVLKGYQLNRILDWIDDYLYQELLKGETLILVKLEKFGYSYSRIASKTKELVLHLTEQRNKSALQFLFNRGVDIKYIQHNQELLSILMDHLSSGFTSILSLFMNNGFSFQLLDQQKDFDQISLELIKKHFIAFIDLIKYGYSFDRISKTDKLDEIVIEILNFGERKNVFKLVQFGYNIQRLYNNKEFEEFVFKSLKDGNVNDLIKIGYPLDKMMDISDKICKLY